MSGFERKNNSDGSPNPKYIDLCDEDPVIPSQKFVCLSFISPDKIIKQREHYMFEKFVQQWEYTKTVEKFSDFLNFMSFKYNLQLNDVVNDYKEFVTEEKAKLKSYEITDDYANFMDRNGDKLTDEFNAKHKFQTSVRGFKFRGAFPTQEAAEDRCKKLRETDPHHDIFVGTGFAWMPWDPDAYKTGRVEFMEEELNQLHQEKIKNEEKAKQEFDARVKDAKRKAIEENIRKAQETGNKLTQTINEQGDLIGVNNSVNFDEREVADTMEEVD